MHPTQTRESGFFTNANTFIVGLCEMNEELKGSNYFIAVFLTSIGCSQKSVFVHEKVSHVPQRSPKLLAPFYGSPNIYLSSLADNNALCLFVTGGRTNRQKKPQYRCVLIVSGVPNKRAFVPQLFIWNTR